MGGDSAGDPEVILFDLGGVLINFGGAGAMGRLAGIDTEAEVWQRWLSCEWVRRFERGWCSADEFASGVVADWGLTITPAQFLEQFRAWPGSQFEGAEALVASVREGGRRVGCLSNTNPLHWEDHTTVWPATELFDVQFLSHEIGLIKPDQEVFEHVSGVLGVAPDRILFLDDNLINVTAARAAGFTAAHVAGVDGARQALVERGVLAARAG